MKRSLRDTASGKNASQFGSGEHNSEAEILRKMASQFDGKSENEVLDQIRSTVAKGKADGTLNDSKIQGIANKIFPLLDGNQRKKLENLLKNLK